MTPAQILAFAFVLSLALGAFVYVMAVTGADQPDDEYDE